MATETPKPIHSLVLDAAPIITNTPPISTLLSQLAAAHIFALCQALDLRAMHIHFLNTLKPLLHALTTTTFATLTADPDALFTTLWSDLNTRLDDTTTLDSAPRFLTIFKSLQPTILDSTPHPAAIAPALKPWVDASARITLDTFHANIDAYARHPDATPFLGAASRRMYRFVRGDLAVPFLRADQNMPKDESVGALVTRVYEAFRDGSVFVPAMECLRAAGRGESGKDGAA